MKKRIRQAIVLTLVLVMTLSSTALADTIVSPTFTFGNVGERPVQTAPAEEEAAPAAAEKAPAAAEKAPAAAEKAPAAEAEKAPAADAKKAPASGAAGVVNLSGKRGAQLKVTVSTNLEGKTRVRAGTEMVLTMHVEGLRNRPCKIQWQQSVDNGETWQDIEGATEEQYKLILAPEHTGMLWRVTIEVEKATKAK